MTIWTIKSESQYKMKLKHPWAYRDELQRAPILPYPGAAVELQSEKGEVLARGYGNLQSKLAFRALSYGNESGQPTSEEFVIYKLLKAWQRKKDLGFTNSFRLCFGEGDGLPGLVIDVYKLHPDLKAQALAIQILTAGMDSILRKNPEIFRNLIRRAFEKELCEFDNERTAIIFRNDVRVREHEGLRKEEARFVQTVREIEWSNVPVLVNSYNKTEPLVLNCDLYQGQKTGLFLDQNFNISTFLRFLSEQKNAKKIKVLDVCCYVGHWSAQISKWAFDHNIEVEIDLIDISEAALRFAKVNAQQNSKNPVTINAIKQDALNDWPLKMQDYDIVICDPPAFVKSAKDIENGLSAYIRLNSESIKRVKKGGFLVSCSCSGLVTKEAFDQAVLKGFIRSSTSGYLLLRGGNAWDHTARPEFSEGHYLKMNTYQVGL